MRFRLRSLLVVFVLLCVSAPWWRDVYHSVTSWIFPVPAFGRAKNVSEEELGQLVSRVHTGMTREEIRSIFGFSENGGSFSASLPDVLAFWKFSVREYDGATVLFEGTFRAGKLKSFYLTDPVYPEWDETFWPGDGNVVPQN